MYFTTSSYSTSHSSTGLLSSHSGSESSLLSNNTGATSLLTPTNDSGFDGGSIGGKDVLFGNPDLSSMDASLFASAPQVETIGSVAFDSAETIGSVAFDSSEAAGSVACGNGTGASIGGDCGGGGGGFSSFC